ncbi:MAG: M3 family oligoendopeptidase, partial [Oscillospiraceae bacterium]|nr:M3 family oligoendopeptidase [Oscillospiraceae bacterium]
MKFPQMPYVRPDFEETKVALTALLERLKAAATKDECFAVYKEIDEYSKEVWSMFAIARIRNTLDTNDEFYDKENDYTDEVGPKLEEVQQEILMALLESPFRKDMEDEWGNLMFLNAEIELKTFKPEIIADLQEENRLESEY